MGDAPELSLAGAHSVRADAALSAAVAFFVGWGAQVSIGKGRENLVRAHAGGFEVQAEGLANLIHELVHALMQGRLADDHDFPYDEIPLSLGEVRHRALMWEELSCCGLSCAYVHADDRDAWFAEQLEILGVFWGLDDDAPAFERLVDGALARWPHEFEAAWREAGARLREAMVDGAGRAGVDVELVGPWAEVEFGELWSRYRAAASLARDDETPAVEAGS